MTICLHIFRVRARDVEWKERQFDCRVSYAIQREKWRTHIVKGEQVNECATNRNIEVEFKGEQEREL